MLIDWGCTVHDKRKQEKARSIQSLTAGTDSSPFRYSIPSPSRYFFIRAFSVLEIAKELQPLRCECQANVGREGLHGNDKIRLPVPEPHKSAHGHRSAGCALGRMFLQPAAAILL
jgi:hypothetical protein